METDKEVLIRGHLGLGDNLITLGILRKLSKECKSVVSFVKRHNSESMRWAVRDSHVIDFITVEDDKEADYLTEKAASACYTVIRLGLFNSEPLDRKAWDEQMYRQAGIDFKHRWNSFIVPRQPSIEIDCPKGDYIFVHDDYARGFKINFRRLPKSLVRVRPSKTSNIFVHWATIENAKEIHCIDSSFAILVDSLPDLKAHKYVMHDYARNGSPPSKWAKDWIHLT
jgi:hypothetical protein